MAGNYRHWKLETDRDKHPLAVARQGGASANVLSADVMAELDRILDELSAKTPRGLSSARKRLGFIAGADVENSPSSRMPMM